MANSCQVGRTRSTVLLLLGRPMTCSVSFLLLCFAVGAAAEQEATTPTPPKRDLTELSLEALGNIDVPTVYAASKVEQKTTEAPSSVTIVTADEIKKFGHRTLVDVLQTVQGLNVSDR